MLVVAAVTHVLVFIREALHNHIGEMLVRDNFPMSMESILRSIYCVQPDVRALSGLQLEAMQYFMAGHTVGIGHPFLLVSQHQPRFSPVASAVVG